MDKNIRENHGDHPLQDPYTLSKVVARTYTGKRYSSKTLTPILDKQMLDFLMQQKMQQNAQLNAIRELSSAKQHGIAVQCGANYFTALIV